MSYLGNTPIVNNPVSESDLESGLATKLNGKVTGPASATDNAIARFDGTTGKLIQGSSIYVDDFGNLGVGTSSPSSRLHVNGDLRAQGNFVLSNTTGQRIYPYYFSATNHNYIGTESDGSMSFGTGVGTVLERIRIGASGNVGIGIAPDPTGRLSISGSASGAWPTTASGLTLNGASSGESTIASYLDASVITIGAGVTQKTGITINGQTSASGSSIYFRTGGSERMRIDTSGNMIMTTGAFREKKNAIPASSIDLATGNLFTKTISGATTFAVTNTSASGNVSSFILDLTNGGSAAITWWTGVKWAGGTAPTLTAAGRDVLGFFTHDGGTTWTGLLLGKDVK